LEAEEEAPASADSKQHTTAVITTTANVYVHWNFHWNCVDQ
jgi:hypothetical protein